MKLLFVDTETGGLDPETSSLLSIGMVVWDDGSVVAQKEILISHDNIVISPNALKVNKINLLEHIERAINSRDALKEMLDFCHQYLGEPPWIAAGHNIYFDVTFLRHFFKENHEKWHTYFSHRSLDTSSILRFLSLSGVLQSEIVSSDEAFNYFDIQIENRHTALGDVIGTAKLFNRLIDLVKQKS